jgi:hypothetical protein
LASPWLAIFEKGDKFMLLAYELGGVEPQDVAEVAKHLTAHDAFNQMIDIVKGQYGFCKDVLIQRMMFMGFRPGGIAVFKDSLSRLSLMVDPDKKLASIPDGQQKAWGEIWGEFTGAVANSAEEMQESVDLASKVSQSAWYLRNEAPLMTRMIVEQAKHMGMNWMSFIAGTIDASAKGHDLVELGCALGLEGPLDSADRLSMSNVSFAVWTCIRNKLRVRQIEEYTRHERFQDGLDLANVYLKTTDPVIRAVATVKLERLAKQIEERRTFSDTSAFVVMVEHSNSLLKSETTVQSAG